MSNLSVFDFKKHPVRVVSSDPSHLLFIAKDVALALGYKVPEQAIRDRCKGQEIYYPLSTSGGTQEVRVIDEPDLYRLIFGSKLKSAVQFQDWVFEEVLPAIRKTGTYTLKINDEQQQIIKDLINQVAAQANLPHRSLYPRLHNKFKISRYQELPAARFDEAVQYLKAKLPKPQMFYGLEEGRYLLHIKDGSTVIRDISDKCIVDRCFVHALRQNMSLVGQQMKWLSGEGSPALLDMTVETLPG